MKKQAFQHGEIRDQNDTILQEGAYGKKSAFINAQNMGILDYIINNLEVLYDGLVAAGMVVYDADGKPVLPNEIKAALQSYVTSAGNSATAADNSAKAAAGSAAAADASAKAAADSKAASDASAASASQSASNAITAASSAATNATNAANSAATAQTNAGTAVEAKNTAVAAAENAASDAERAKEYAEASASITLAAGTIYVDQDGYLEILEVQSE